MSEPLAQDALLESIAVVGMSGRFPGAANLDEFWENLCAGVESVTFFDEEELLEAGVEPQTLADPSYVPAQAILDDVELFDADFFDISPRTAELTDPQHRVFLECAWEALEDAGCDPDRYPGEIGIYAGTGMNSYLLTHYGANPELATILGNLQTAISNQPDFLATLAAYKLNLKGPALSVQTACSTSLVAVHLACQALLNYQCDMALAGGVKIRVPVLGGYRYLEGGIYSSDGHCRPFSASAGGIVGGSGVGLVVLKRLAEALEDGDRIRAVLRGSAINNDGSAKVGYTAPSIDGQARVIAMAQEVAGVAPETVSYVEAHGTGTPLGDPIEVAALRKVFHGVTEEGVCALGSVKSNFGHLDIAAGIAGLIKTVLALEHRQIPPSLHGEPPNPALELEGSPFTINTRLRHWPAGSTPRRAGVSSFGIGGTNAHAVLEQAPAQEPSGPSRPWQLLLLSARSSAALERASERLARHLEASSDALADAAFTLRVGRRSFDHRRAVLAVERAGAVEALRQLDPHRVISGQQRSEEPPVCFLFPGQGSQFAGMAAELYRTEPEMRRRIDESCQLLEPHLGFDLRPRLFASGSEAEGGLDPTALAQPALFVVEYALAKLWESWGVVPRAMLGHSIGEYVAACLAGVLSLADALALVAARGRLVGQLSGGAMLAVRLDEDDVLARLGNELSLAAVNRPGLCVVSGPAAAVEGLERRLEGDGVSCRRLHTSHAFHSRMMEPILPAFAAELRKVRLRAPTLPYPSGLTGTWIDASEATDPDYWVRHLRQPVRFAGGLETLLREPQAVLLEVGPGTALTTLARQHPARGKQHTVLASLHHPRRERSEAEALLKAVGHLWVTGVEIDWPSFDAGEKRRRVALPTYPFERRRCWLETPVAGRSSPAVVATAGTAGPSEESPASASPERVGELSSTSTEQILAGIWSELLGVERIDPRDNFFDLGGDSLLCVEVVSRAHRAGLALSVPLMMENQTLAELAVAVGREAPPAAGPAALSGSLPLLPSQRWYFERGAVDLNHSNLGLFLEVPKEFDPAVFREVLAHLCRDHDALRVRFVGDGPRRRQQIDPPGGQIRFHGVDLSRLAGERRRSALERAASQVREQLDIERGPLHCCCWFDLGRAAADRLLILVHHLVLDAASFQFFLADLWTAYQQRLAGQPIDLPPRTASLGEWIAALRRYLEAPERAQEIELWVDQPWSEAAEIPLDEVLVSCPRNTYTISPALHAPGCVAAPQHSPTMPASPRLASGADASPSWHRYFWDRTPGPNIKSSARKLRLELDESSSRALLSELPRRHGLDTRDLLLAGPLGALAEWTGCNHQVVYLLDHGRGPFPGSVDVSRTVGWFATSYPVLLAWPGGGPWQGAVAIAEQRKAVPHRGFGYGVLRYFSPRPEVVERMRSIPTVRFEFDYLGRIGTQGDAPSPKPARESFGPAADPGRDRVYVLKIVAAVVDGRIRMELDYSRNLHRRSTVERLARRCQNLLEDLARGPERT